MKLVAYWIIALIAFFYLLLCLFFYLFQEKFLFLPQKLDSSFYFHFKHLYREVTLTHPNDKAKLNNLWFRVKNPKGVVLFFHGNAGNLDRWGNMAESFCQKGYDVFMHDYRQYGKSTGVLSEKALLEDAQLCYDFVAQAYTDLPITIYGRSIGTGIASYIASKNKAERLILETPYYNLIELTAYYAPFLPVRWLLRYHLRSDVYVNQVNCPIYIIHGTADETVPYTSGKKLAQQFGKKVTFYTIEGGKHNDLSSYVEYHVWLGKVLNPTL